VRIIKVYESDHLIVVLAKSHLSPGDIADTVLGYLYESEEDQPRSLFSLFIILEMLFPIFSTEVHT
jgi:hypothetical protein